MGKRSKFERVEKDFYPTPYDACVPLFPFIIEDSKITYYEPCVGRGDLIRHLAGHATCIGHSDLYKSEFDSTLDDARTAQYATEADYFITNPPWSRELLHPIIENLARQKPTWLLIDADWMHTKQAALYIRRLCVAIVSVGRVKWIPDSPYTGKDNVCWYLFDSLKDKSATLFFPRRTEEDESETDC